MSLLSLRLLGLEHQYFLSSAAVRQSFSFVSQDLVEAISRRLDSRLGRAPYLVGGPRVLREVAHAVVEHRRNPTRLLYRPLLLLAAALPRM